MLSQIHRDIVTACVPALRAHGLTLTTTFYQRLFTAHPYLRNVFNMSHQVSGVQQQALAMAVLSYAEHINNPTVLAPALSIIAAKHASMGIRAEYYPLVGTHLLAAIEEVMGEAATSEVLDAWGAAYDQLAKLLIEEETDLYHDAAVAPGGWSGWRSFRISKIVKESDAIRSIYLTPTDDGILPPFKPGQFVTIRTIDASGLTQLRQYSLSDAPGRDYLRITVKREIALGVTPAGVVSNIIHDVMEQGAMLDLSFPQGAFTADSSSEEPLVLLSAGVGITPMLGITEHVMNAQPSRLIYFYHATRDRKSHVMGDWLRDKASCHESLHVRVYYETVAAEDEQGLHYDQLGRMDAASLVSMPELASASYYVCGPRGFMSAQIEMLRNHGVPPHRILTEVFGATLS